jgi:hypothetical protein
MSSKPLRKLLTTVGPTIAWAAIALALFTSPASAQPTTCTGVLTGTHDSIVVPSGADCTLVSAQVKGNVQVMPGGSLLTTGVPSTTIGGNVHGIHPKSVFMQFATQVGGNFNVHGGDAGTTSGFDIGAVIGGNATIEGNARKTFVDVPQSFASSMCGGTPARSKSSSTPWARTCSLKTT